MDGWKDRWKNDLFAYLKPKSICFINYVYTLERSTKNIAKSVNSNRKITVWGVWKSRCKYREHQKAHGC